MAASKTFDRREFIDRFMRESGLTYSQACRVYATMCRIFEDAVIKGTKVTIGRVGSLVPKWRPPRDVQMHFRKHGNKVEKGIHRTFFLDGRYDFKFRLYRRFIATHRVDWSDIQPPDAAL